MEAASRLDSWFAGTGRVRETGLLRCTKNTGIAAGPRGGTGRRGGEIRKWMGARGGLAARRRVPGVWNSWQGSM